MEAEAEHLPLHRSTIVSQSVYLLAAAFHFFCSIFPRSIYWVFFFFLLCLRERVKSKMFTEGDLRDDIFSFSLLEPGERPAENPSLWLRCTVVEQRVLTARTAVLFQPRVNANPRGTVVVARNDCLLLYTIV